MGAEDLDHEFNIVLAALEYAERLMWPIFPCNPLDKRPLTKHGFKEASMDPTVIRAFWERWPNAMIGVPMGSNSGVFCLDLDRKEGKHDGVATWAKLELANACNIVTRRHYTPSTGQHLIFWHQAGIRNIPLDKLAPGIEVKGEGGYIIVPPSRMADGKKYSDNGEDITEVPAWLSEMIFNYLNRDEELEERIKKDSAKKFDFQDNPKPDYGEPSIDEIREALNNISSDNYEDWFKIGAAIRKELGDAGYVLFDEWSRKSKKYNAREVRRKWNQIKDIRNVKAGTIFYHAEKENPGWRSRFRQEDFHEQIKPDQAKGDEKPKSILLKNKEFVASYVPAEYLMSNWLQRKFVYSLTGPTGSGKTLVALRLAAHIVKGETLAGCKMKQGKVLYFAGENPDYVRICWIKLCEEMQIPADTPNMIWLEGFKPFRDRTGKLGPAWEQIRIAATELGPISMLIIDTSAAYFQGDDENSNTQLGDYAKLFRIFVKSISGEPTVMVLCHSTKYPDMENLIPRGGSAFLNEIDGNLGCVKDNMLIEIKPHGGKWRGVESAPLLFELKPCRSGLFDSDGNPVFSILASPISGENYDDIVGLGEKRSLELMHKMLMKPRLSLSQLAVELKWSYSNGDPNKVLVQRLMEKLKVRKFVELDGDRFVLTNKGKQYLKNAVSPTPVKDEGLI